MTALTLLVALSATPASWGLRWAAPSECRQAADVSRAVEDQLKRPVFGPDASVLVDGVVERLDQSWRARISLVDAQGTVLGTREVTSTEPSCASLDGKVTLVVALLIDPSAMLGPPPEAPPAAAPALPPPPTDTPQGLFADSRRVHLLVESDAPPLEVRRVVLQGTAEGGTHTSSLTGVTTVCVEPCGVPVAPGDGYFVTGAGVLTSERFTLPDAREVRLQVKTARLSRLAWAGTGATLGLLAVITGSIVAAVVRDKDWGVTGGMLGLAGAGALALSFGIVFGGGRTEVLVLPVPR